MFSLGGTLLLYLILRVRPFTHLDDPLFQPGPVAPHSAREFAPLPFVDCLLYGALISPTDAIAGWPAK